MSSTSASNPTPMTYAQALTDAKSLIVQQSARIKADAQKLKTQADEIAEWRRQADEMAAELERLRGVEQRLEAVEASRAQAEAIAGRQRTEIEALETASRELQKILGDQAARINDLSAELDQVRGALPTEDDEAALEAMKSLLSAARKPRPRAEQPAEAQGTRMERMVIPADPTPFCQVAERHAA
jgi:predicted RNase H-like nuclease (RuvC/YqgF family)